jgi:hypothetical protein
MDILKPGLQQDSTGSCASGPLNPELFIVSLGAGRCAACGADARPGRRRAGHPGAGLGRQRQRQVCRAVRRPVHNQHYAHAGAHFNLVQLPQPQAAAMCSPEGSVAMASVFLAARLMPMGLSARPLLVHWLVVRSVPGDVILRGATGVVVCAGRASIRGDDQRRRRLLGGWGSGGVATGLPSGGGPCTRHGARPSHPHAELQAAGLLLSCCHSSPFVASDT